jgi:butyrate kinase
MPFEMLVLNPGAGSTKIAVFRDRRPLFEESIRHSQVELRRFEKTNDQFSWRRDLVMAALARRAYKLSRLSAIVSRGGPYKSLVGGTYRITKALVSDITGGKVQADHPSNLGALIADEMASGLGIPAFFVDPVSVDEMIDEARLSGWPECIRRSLDHPLNTKMVARKAASKLRSRYETMNLVVAHLGTGISITANRKGRMIDVSNANDGGPFSPQRTGGLPTTEVVKLCFSGKYTKEELLKKLTFQGGLLAYLGTDSISEVERRIALGDRQARLVYQAMVYQIAKETAAMAAVLDGKVDCVVITGGMAYSKHLIRDLKAKIRFLGPVLVFPGDNEMEALALGCLRVLKKEEKERVYE